MKNKLIILLGAVLIIAGIGLSIENRFATNVADTTHNDRVKAEQNLNNVSEQKNDKNTNININKDANKDANQNVNQNINKDVDTVNVDSSCYGDYKLDGARSYIAALMLQSDADLTLSENVLKLSETNSNVIYKKNNPKFSAQTVNAAGFTDVYGESPKVLGITEKNITVYTLRDSGEIGFEFTQINNEKIIISYNGSPYVFNKIENKDAVSK